MTNASSSFLVVKNNMLKHFLVISILFFFSLSNASPKYKENVKDADGNVYPTVKIGNQIWMAKNYNLKLNGSWCYNNDEKNCEIYGRLYTWSMVMNMPDSCNAKTCNSKTPKTHKGICPEGFHVPFAWEYRTLYSYVREKDYSPRVPPKLKSKTLWIANNNGTDEFGFNALPAGSVSDVKIFNGLSMDAFFWTADESDNENAECFLIDYMLDDGVECSPMKKRSGLSLRCIKD